MIRIGSGPMVRSNLNSIYGDVLTVAYPPIEDHGIIGDLNTIALVSTNGTIDFLCFPDFDSPTCFCRAT